MSDVIMTADEWLSQPQYDGCMILDPDGWDRRPDKFQASWNEKITAVEFEKRMAISTCMFSRNFLNKYIK